MKWLLAMQLTAWSALVAIGGELPRVWMSTSFMKDLGVFEKTVKDCRAHGVDVMDNDPTPGARICAERLSICRAHGMKLHVGVSDASKNEMLAKKTGNYELAVMSGGCNAATCRKMLRTFDRYPGASLGERVEAYALDCGFSKEDIAKFRGIMLER